MRQFLHEAMGWGADMENCTWCSRASGRRGPRVRGVTRVSNPGIRKETDPSSTRITCCATWDVQTLTPNGEELDETPFLWDKSTSDKWWGFCFECARPYLEEAGLIDWLRNECPPVYLNADDAFSIMADATKLCEEAEAINSGDLMVEAEVNIRKMCYNSTYRTQVLDGDDHHGRSLYHTTLCPPIYATATRQAHWSWKRVGRSHGPCGTGRSHTHVTRVRA